uniref:SFRICE018009.2 n=1 Tax=Spodoptera frugiperda TaxID=7108 RepID=A0A2H1VPY5_SPOFR
MFRNTFNSTFLFKHLIEHIDAVYTAFPEEDLMRRYNTDGMASPGFGLQANPIRDRPSSLLFKEGLTFTFWRRIYYFITIQFPARKIFKVFSLSSLGSHELFPVCAGRNDLYKAPSSSEKLFPIQ